MKPFLLALSLFLIAATPQQNILMKNMYAFQIRSIDGSEYNLDLLKGKKVMIVNTASECGLTPQYAQLEELYQAYKSKNFIIIGFPANNFGTQEPGTDTEIEIFCKKNYGVSFPMMSKISVKGEDMHPLYQWLTKKSENGISDAPVKWNFQKFLIDENGNWVKSIAPTESPISPEIIDWINLKK